MEIARFVLGTILLAVAALLTVQLYNGRWLSLIARPKETKKGTYYPEGTINTGKRAAWVMVACFAVVATLMAYEMAMLTGIPVFVQAATIVNNVALVAYFASLLYTCLLYTSRGCGVRRSGAGVLRSESRHGLRRLPCAKV